MKVCIQKNQNKTNPHVWKVISIETSAFVWFKLDFLTEKDKWLYQFHEYCNHLKKVTKMAVILMDLLHTGIFLRFILLSNVIFEFVLIFADNLRVFYSFFGRLVRQASLGLSAKLNTDENMKFESLIFLKSI